MDKNLIINISQDAMEKHLGTQALYDKLIDKVKTAIGKPSEHGSSIKFMGRGRRASGREARHGEDSLWQISRDYTVTIALNSPPAVQALEEKFDKLNCLLDGIEGLDISSEPEDLIKARLSAIASTCHSARLAIMPAYIELSEREARRVRMPHEEIAVELGFAVFPETKYKKAPQRFF
jgi:hypothetical protein